MQASVGFRHVFKLEVISKFAAIFVACLFVVGASAILDLELDSELDLEEFDEPKEEFEFAEDPLVREDRASCTLLHESRFFHIPMSVLISPSERRRHAREHYTLCQFASTRT